tara:strand:+ start:258 stop:533 length:276 start_codon:yes stop_codon:yes gene_type:complete
MSDKKRKVPKTLVPEAAHGAGRAGKYKVKSQGAKGATRKGVEKSSIRHYTSLNNPPPKRKKGWQAKGDAALIRFLENELNKPVRPRRNTNR